MATCWARVSVVVDPYPSSHASQDPACAGSLAALLITPEEAAHGEAVPVSKPGLPSNWDGVQLPADALTVGLALALALGLALGVGLGLGFPLPNCTSRMA